MNIEQRIRALEQRIDALSAPETSSPPGGLKILPSGEVVYEFEGIIIALGVKLPEATLSEETPINFIEWQRSGERQESLLGVYNPGVYHALQMLVGSNNLLTIYSDITNATKNFVSATAFNEQVTLIDGANKSSFPKKYKTNAKDVSDARVNWGTVQLEWPGGSAGSNVSTTNHGLGKTPTSIVLTMGGYPFFFNVVANYGEPNSNNFKIQAEFPSGFKPVAGTKINCSWFAGYR